MLGVQTVYYFHYYVFIWFVVYKSESDVLVSSI